MNASLLAALASPTGKTPAKKTTSKPKRAESAVVAGKSNKENLRLLAVSAAAKGGDAEGCSLAPAFTVPEASSAPGRMENLRVLIEEGKKAAAEGRLAAALRKYETAMVTLPEAYKPRLRNKIAKLEARLDEEEDRPRRSSPLARGLGGYGRVISSSSDAGQLSTPTLREDDANEGGVTGLENGLASRLIMSLARAATEERQGSSTPRRGARSFALRRFEAEGASFSNEEEASRHAGEGGDDEPFGLGAAVGGACDGDEEAEGTDKQVRERMRAINRGLSHKLERQVVTIMNEASSQDLTELHGIGLRRAQLIVQTRAAAPFETLADLSRIGMYPKQIEKMGRHNMLECLDVYPAKMGSPS
eukprot:jgi/Undpi1/3569/HiC_scaffold_16.g06941.m1